MNKNILLLWQGQLVSQLGTQAFSIAMMFWLMENTGSSALMSIILTLSILPSILFGPLAGVVADRISRKKIIIITDMIRGLAVLSLSIMIFSGIGSQTTLIFSFAAIAVINGICRAFFQPAIDAWIPDLVPVKKLPKTIAFFSSSTQCASIAGQALGGILYKILGAPMLLFIDAISYLLSAVSESFIKTDKNENTDPELNLQTKHKQYKTDLIEGFRYVKSRHGMLQTMFFASSINFFIAPIMLLLPFYVSQQLSTHAHWYGFLLAGMASGSFVGFWISSSIKSHGNNRIIIMFSSILVLACCLFLFSQSYTPLNALLYITLIGICLGLFNLQTMTLFQTSSPSKFRGRIMSLLMTISSGLLPLGLLTGGVLGTLTNNNTQLIFSISVLLY
ncbi:MAG: MFS transporter [Alteromonadaceae bacterium]|nr:MFS transporter [Alteromonadaceae bacterium]